MRKTQEEVQRKYDLKMRKQDMVHMRIWVPRKYREEMLGFAKDLREIANGKDAKE